MLAVKLNHRSSSLSLSLSLSFFLSFSLPVSKIDSSCPGPGDTPLLQRGYISSPNYPERYYMNADCRWRLVVQRTQTIRLTLFDFELDVRRHGECTDTLDVLSAAAAAAAAATASTATSPAGHDGGGVRVGDDKDGGDSGVEGGFDGGGRRRVYFSDCGALGKQIIEVNASEAVVRFSAGRSGLTQRGFLLYFEGESFRFVYPPALRDAVFEGESVRFV